MLFNSYEFLFAYLPTVFLLFFLIAKKNHVIAAGFLGIASVFFYGWFNPNSLPILLLSVVANYYFGALISKSKNVVIFYISIVLNLALLSFFKYANFLIDNANYILTEVNNPTITALNIALPIGISFFTFTQIAFLVDCQLGKVKEKSFIHYLLFVTYFPHLIAGPVLHHSQMMPQFANKSTYQPNYEKISLGILIFTIGLGKKILIANPLGEYADSFFNHITTSSSPSFFNSWLGILSYTFQIYFDFSGYTDMAIGISLLFGITLPVNFNAPYQSTSIIDFWRKWHISLSTFLKDYLYFPLGGSRHGTFTKYRNLLITMVLGGLWHGANWTFVLWGLAHGILLSINHAWRNLNLIPATCNRFITMLCWSITFLFICLTWVLFRVDNIEHIVPIYKGLFGANGFDSIKSNWSFSNNLEPSFLYNLLIVSFLIIWHGKPSHVIQQALTQLNQKVTFVTFKVKMYTITTLTFIFMMYCINRVGNYNPFLYFQF